MRNNISGLESGENFTTNMGSTTHYKSVHNGIMNYPYSFDQATPKDY
jgi:hypothetical protein